MREAKKVGIREATERLCRRRRLDEAKGRAIRELRACRALPAGSLQNGSRHFGLETQAGVGMAAPGAGRGPGFRLRGVELPAADAVKRQLPALGIEERLIAAVVVDPDPKEESEDEEAIDDSASSEVHVC